MVGPLYGAVVLAVADWEEIFWINLGLGLVLAAGLLTLRPKEARTRPDWVLCGLALLSATAVTLVMLQPERLVTSVSLGEPFVPFSGDNRWYSPIGIVAVVRCCSLIAKLDPRRWSDTFRSTDVLGAVPLGLALAGVILAFATADPAVQVFSPAGPRLLIGSAIAAALFVVRTGRQPACSCRTAASGRPPPGVPCW